MVAAILSWMSRAFIKEDVDPPERSGRKRSASGLPPGATNYITARGAKRFRDELNKLRAGNASGERIIELEQILASGHVVDPPNAPSNSVTFGAPLENTVPVVPSMQRSGTADGLSAYADERAVRAPRWSNANSTTAARASVPSPFPGWPATAGSPVRPVFR